MLIEYRGEEMGYLHSIFYLQVIYGGEEVDRLVIPPQTLKWKCVLWEFN